MRKAFTLLELILVIAIVASLIGFILSVLNPAQRLDEGNDAKALTKTQDIKKAIVTYSISNNGIMPTNLDSKTTYGLYDICRSGQTSGCVNLDELVTAGYLSEIPVDDRYDSNTVSGYKLEYDPFKKNVNIFTYEDYIDYVKNGATLPTQQIAWWKTNETSGTSASDSSGSGYTGTLVSSPTWTTGKYGNGLQFSGSNYVSTNLTWPTSGTISLWAYPTAYSDWISPIGWKYAPASGGYILIDEGGSGSPGTWRAVFRPGTTGESSITGTAISQNNWTHLVYTWSLSGNTYTLYFYINGSQVGTTTWTGTPSANIGPLYFGTAGQSTNNNYTGKVDDIRIHNRALNAEEVSALYNYAHPPLAHWKFDESSGTAAADSSGNSMNATLQGGAFFQAGMHGNAVTLDGVNDYVTVGQSVFNNIRAFTVTGWVKPNTGGTRVGFFGQNDTLEFGYSTGTTAQVWIDAGGGVSSNFGTIPTGTWTYISAAWDGVTLRAYVNGNLINSSPTSNNIINNSVYSFNIGGGGVWDATGNWYSGQIDDVRIYNYAITPEQIQRIMDNEI